jgi:hypothetical protein
VRSVAGINVRHQNCRQTNWSWGVGLYQSDAGLDVRDTYRDCRKMGFRGGELAAIVLDTAGIGASPEGEDEIAGYPALADLLWRDGMLPEDLRESLREFTAKTPDRRPRRYRS